MRLAEKVVYFLNEVHELDSKVLTALMGIRAPCNKKVFGHPSIQVSEDSTVGILGLLNGLCGSTDEGYGAVAIEVQDDGQVLGARLLRSE